MISSKEFYMILNQRRRRSIRREMAMWKAFKVNEIRTKPDVTAATATLTHLNGTQF